MSQGKQSGKPLKFPSAKLVLSAGKQFVLSVYFVPAGQATLRL